MKAFRSNKFDITPSKQIIKEGTNSYFNWKQQLEPLLSAIPNQCEIGNKHYLAFPRVLITIHSI
jgi:hypothetical protein